MRTLNLGIIAHVDAGKTSLTEHLLYAAGVSGAKGRVDDGSTQTDTLALERQRGITIKSAVVSFDLDGTTVNLIDTPGHPDFIAEVERVLAVLDGAVLVLSAVEGVQAQTRVLMRAVRRLRIPVLVLVNKIDRGGAQPMASLLRRIRDRLVPDVIAMGETSGEGTRGAAFRSFGADDHAFRTGLTDLLTRRSDALLSAYLADEGALGYPRLRTELATQTRRAQVHPVFFGSAITGAGMPELAAGIRELLPTATGDRDGPLSATVFKVERGPAGERIAYVRMFSGALRVRERLNWHRTPTSSRTPRPPSAKPTAVRVFERGRAVPADEVTAGRIAKVWGLGDVRIGDQLGDPAQDRALPRSFPPPSLETVVVPCPSTGTAALHGALTQLAEQDPLINLRQDDTRGEISVSLYGEVQKEVIQATLADEFGVPVTFRGTTTICVERPVASGAAAEIIDKAPNPFLATVGLRVDPGPPGSGVEFRLEVELGSMPYAFIRAVEETVQQTLAQGPHGWRVLDCVVSLTHSGYWARQSHAGGDFDKSMSSTAGDFRDLTPLVLMRALDRAGTEVLEPAHHFQLDLPADCLSGVLPVLPRFGAVPHAPEQTGAVCRLEGTIPAARVHALARRLPSLTHGEGVLESAFSHHQPVRHGPVPTRPRTGPDPLNRRGYLLALGERRPAYWAEE